MAAILLGCAASLASDELGANSLLVAAIAAVALTPVLIRVSRGPVDVFDPMVITSAVVLLFYVARPIYDARVDYVFLGVDVSETYDAALVAALVATASFVVAYHLPLGARVARALPRPAGVANPQILLLVGLVCTVLSLIAFAALIETRGGWENLFQNRETGAFYEVPAIVGESPAIAVPAIGLLWLARERYGIGAVLLAAIPFSMLLVLAVPRGDRRVLLPLVVMMVALFFLNRDRRPRVMRSLLLLLLVLVVIVRPLGESRDGNLSYKAALGDSVRDPISALEGTIEAQDASIVTHSAMAIDTLGDGVGYRHGVEFASNTVLVAIPGDVWAGKPEKVRTLLISSIFGSCVVQCPTYGAVTELYADFRLISVMLGMALMAIVFSAAYRYYRAHGEDPLVRLGYALTVWIVFYPWWAGYGYLVLHGALLVGPVVVAAVLSKRAPPPRSGT